MANTTPRHILRLTTEEKRKFLDSFDYIFSDIDGVIWNIREIIAGTSDGFKALKDVGKQLNFITNNSLKPVEHLMSKFNSLGLDVKEEEIWHPAKSIVAYLQSINFNGLVYCIGAEIFKNILRTAGFSLIDGPNKILEESFTDMARHVFDSEPVRAVVIDIDFNLSIAKLIRAQHYLNNSECVLIAGATDIALNVTETVNLIGPGYFLKILEDCSKKPAIKLGKPGIPLAEMLLKYYRVTNPRRVLMIGDTLEQDVAFAKACDFQSLLVLSGCCKLKDIENPPNDSCVPEYYADGVIDFVEFIMDLNKANV